MVPILPASAPNAAAKFLVVFSKNTGGVEMSYRGKLGFILFALACGTGTALGQDFSLDNGSLTFSANAGTSPASQTVTLTNNTANPISISISTRTQSGGPWLNAGITPNPVPASGGTATITVSVSSSVLQPNTYT